MTFKTIFQFLKKNYASTISGIVVLVCLGVYFVREGQIKRLSADFDDLSIRRTRMLKNFKYAAGLTEDLASAKSMLKETENRLFHPGDLAGNQRYFYQLESATHVKLQNLQQIIEQPNGSKRDKMAAKRAAKSKYQEITYEMNVTGTYEEVVGFLRHLEGGSAFYRIEGFTIGPIRGPETEAAVGMRIGLKILGEKS